MKYEYWIDKDEWRAMTDAARVLERRLSEAEAARLPHEHIKAELAVVRARMADKHMRIRGLDDNPSWLED